MTQTRGESHGNQEKFRLTVDLEQVIYNWGNAPEEPKGVWGLTSVTFTGAHFNAQNADEHRRYIWDEARPPHIRFFFCCTKAQVSSQRFFNEEHQLSKGTPQVNKKLPQLGHGVIRVQILLGGA